MQREKKNRLPEIKCPACDKVIRAKRRWQKYCSPACRVDSWRDKKVDELYLDKRRLDKLDELAIKHLTVKPQDGQTWRQFADTL